MFTLDKKFINKYVVIDNTEIYNLRGFLMGNGRNYTIEGSNVKNIDIMHNELNHPLVMREVYRHYSRLIEFITNLLLDDDDDTGASYHEALNQIEKFRLIIKNKYRAFLEKEELAFMAKQLQTLKREATMKLMEIQASYKNYGESSRGGK